MVFMQPQRLIVPLFQRPYVWNEENQWEPLWNDVARVADRLLKQPNERHQPHFLGAVVLQQVQNPIGLMQTRTIIDGQQRLNAIAGFMRGEFALHEPKKSEADEVYLGAKPPAWSGKHFKDLDPADRKRLLETPLSTVEITEAADGEVKTCSSGFRGALHSQRRRSEMPGQGTLRFS